MMPVNSDAAKAAVTVAAQRIAAYADRNNILVESSQCEELAESLLHVYQAYFTGLAQGAGQPYAAPTASTP
ncbi:hypothetical protein [Phytohabitans rumicis]|uniref:Uncharacterized protein n=1 Tax=Phytohabitans rumicis TaxID=1076125 RepID=A0A6V8LH40_9ACTN|nr:hypothetical protein [Phytohabitans rumicis]GFJ93416.1 hypothetical protein Prum_070580 [Phytohabitans rumicis]